MIRLIKKDFSFELIPTYTNGKEEIELYRFYDSNTANYEEIERKVKGIYLPAYIVGKEERFNPIFENIKKTNINTIVVDVKDEIGRITFPMDNDFVKSKKTIEPQIKDIDAFINLCKEKKVNMIRYQFKRLGIYHIHHFG